MVSCFVSYTASDASWAEWVADILRAAGHSVVVQATDFLPGDNFVLRMQEAAAESDHTIVILSDRFLASRFGAAEWAAAFVQDPTGRRRKLIPIAVDDVRPRGLWASIIRIDIHQMSEDVAREEVLRAITPSPRPAPAFPGRVSPVISPVRADGPTVDVWRLSASTANMVGRATESANLTRSWISDEANIIVIHGWGGAGKTTLVSHWLAEMAQSRYHGAEAVFAWSFDGQSDVEQWATSDQFFEALIRFLDIRSEGVSTTWERCREVTTALQRSRSLVILDGLERLQHPPGPLEGTFRERVMQMFLRELAAFNAGMLVVTSRMPIIDIDSYVGKTCQVIPIPELSRAESIEMLRGKGVHGELSDLSAIADAVRDHPLSLQLLGGYLYTVFAGDARNWQESGLSRAIAGEGGNTSAIMDQYVAWFAERPELQLLSLLGLFNREATSEELMCLRQPPVLVGLNDTIVDMTRDEFAYCLRSLRRAGLIVVHRDNEIVDAHPLVREYFQRRLRANTPEAYRQGHRRLRDFLDARSPQRPDTLEQCTWIIAAIWHGTRAGDNATAYRHLYLPMLSREDHFLRDALGAAASNFTALSSIIEDEGHSDLLPQEMADILADQSLDLRMMGNTADAVLPILRAIDIARVHGDSRRLTNMLRHCSQLELVIGRVEQSCLHAAEAVENSSVDRGSQLETLAARTSFANSLLHAGRYVECVELLRACGLFDQPSHSVFALSAGRLTSFIALYRAFDSFSMIGRLQSLGADVGITQAALGSMAVMVGEISEQALTLSRDAGNDPGPLGSSLVGLLQARIALNSKGAEADVRWALGESVEVIRGVGQRPWIIEANLVLSEAERYRGATAEALEAVETAERLATSDRMVLQGLACRVERTQVEAASTGKSVGTALLNIAAEAERYGLIFVADLAAALSVQ